MIYDWYKVINKADFEATGFVSQTVEIILDGIGSKEILVTKGNFISLSCDGIMLSVNMCDKNPFEFGTRAVYLDSNDDIWLGMPNED